MATNPNDQQGVQWRLDVSSRHAVPASAGSHTMTDARSSENTKSTAAANRHEMLLLEFLRENDASCPMCGYNVRALRRPVCPECRQTLTLTVGVARIRLGWLFVALVPGFFSAIAACFLAIPTLGAWIEDGEFVPPLAGAVLFGWTSGALAFTLAAKVDRFIGQSRGHQRLFALSIWAVHVVAFGLLVLTLGMSI